MVIIYWIQTQMIHFLIGFCSSSMIIILIWLFLLFLLSLLLGLLLKNQNGVNQFTENGVCIIRTDFFNILFATVIRRFGGIHRRNIRKLKQKEYGDHCDGYYNKVWFWNLQTNPSLVVIFIVNRKIIQMVFILNNPVADKLFILIINLKFTGIFLLKGFCPIE